MPIAQTIGSTPVPVKIWTKDVDSASLDQLKNIARLPFVFHHVAAMADVHLGIGATVGSVVATKDAVIPAAVGVDIGCGMAALKLPIKADRLEGKLHDIRRAIERVVPVGFESHRDPIPECRQWKRWADFANLHPQAQDLKKKAMLQVGTLGGGNHFIELCLDAGQAVWLMLHSGSRNLGKSVAEIHINQAKSLIKRMSVALPDRDLAYFVKGTKEFAAYMHDLSFCQDYAMQNRQAMLASILRQLSFILDADLKPEFVVNCHHNYAAVETHFGREVIVTRKGAVRAGQGDMGIIPGSMGTRSYIVRGKGSEESFESCSHGAGRRMSRHEAKRRFTVADLQKQTQGVECRKDAGVLDEIPSAYKPIDEVMKNQSDLVEVVAELKQVLCVKG